jgi:addiction module RelE/StbE family toxin
MDFKVLITDSAIADLKEIVEFVAADNPEAATRLGEKLLARALSLETLPERFPFHDRLRGIRKMPVSPFLIYYKCDEETSVVNILHFWHGARRRPEFPE